MMLLPVIVATCLAPASVINQMLQHMSLGVYLFISHFISGPIVNLLLKKTYC